MKPISEILGDVGEIGWNLFIENWFPIIIGGMVIIGIVLLFFTR